MTILVFNFVAIYNFAFVFFGTRRCKGQIITSFKWSPLEKLNVTGWPQGRVLASAFIENQPVYISITTISQRISHLAQTVKSIIFGDIVPTHIYIMISKESYLHDKGVPSSKVPHELRDFMQSYPVSIIYTNNIGPHRKLLPVLSKYWNDDCVIITLDDDVIYHRNTLLELIKAYVASGRNSVVALRSHRIGFCSYNKSTILSTYKYWPTISYGTREMLLLPTGTGGILYRPDFFHEIVFDKQFIALTKTGDDIAFRLACIIKDVPVVTACRSSRETKYLECPESYPIISTGIE